MINSVMPRISLWNPTKTNDFSFIDRVVGEHLYAGGTGVHVHKYLGVNSVADGKDPTRPSTNGETSETYIQDLLFLENRDRKYDKDIYEMRGQYNIESGDAFDLTQFGMFLANDTLFMNFHLESMISAMGRKLMPGDVLELPHLRDDAVLGQDEAINRFYVVTDGSRPAEGFDPRWWPHLWRVKLGPISDSQEYRDILGTGEEEGDLRNLISTYADEIVINDAIVAAAENDVPYSAQYRQTAHLYVDEEVPDKPLVSFADSDGQPPNGATIVGSGVSFPANGASEGDFFLRTDFVPNRLFKKEGNRWRLQKTDLRGSWSAANSVLSGFINNSALTTNTDGTTSGERVNLSQVVKPKTDN
jgi:hypothetical protein|tara:strand:+ start:3543 stop:4619 length:1077 start_codon:yes stop_codon:yes gene_type:complete